jgi:hypothetical protein
VVYARPSFVRPLSRSGRKSFIEHIYGGRLGPYVTVQFCGFRFSAPSHILYCANECANHRISLCTYEKSAENDTFGSCFRHPFHHTPTHASGRFNLFLGSSPERSHRRTVAHVFDIHSHSPSPSSPLPPSLLSFSVNSLLSRHPLLNVWVRRHSSPVRQHRHTCMSHL